MLADNQQVVVHRIVNPFDPRQIVVERRDWEPLKPVSKYFESNVFTPEMVISVNGKIIDPSTLQDTYLLQDDHIVICPIPQGGGGGGKNILRTVALIAVAVVAPQVAAAYGLTGFTAAAVTVGVTIAGTLLVNAIIPPVLPKTAELSLGNGELVSRSYGIDGAKNTSDEGIPVPVCYGQFRMGGNLINAYVENVDSENQDLYLLFNAGEGVVEALTDFQINESPISNYTNVEVYTRRGESSQDPIPQFATTRRAVPVARTLSAGFFEVTTTGEVDNLRADIVFDQGLFTVNSSSGATSARSVTVEIQVRKNTDNFWTSPVVESTQSTSATVFASGEVITSPKINLVSADTVPAGDGLITITSTKKVPIRYSLPILLPVEGKYQIRIRRTTDVTETDFIRDNVVLTDLVEVMNERVTYPNTALVGLKIRLNDQLSGLPNFTFLNQGIRIKTYSGTSFANPVITNSSNPAWIALDMLTNSRYGAGMALSRMDFVAFKRWAQYCDSANLHFNGVIDFQSTLWDAIQLVCRVGHAQIVNIGTRYSVAIESPSLPVMLFGMGNIIKDSFSIDWLSTIDRANEIEVSYYDASDNHREKTLRVYDSNPALQGKAQRTAAIRMLGVTSEATAYREAIFQLNQNRLIRQSVTFEATVEAIACTVGDVIVVSHDMPQWGFAGRIEPNALTSTALFLGFDFTFKPLTNYQILLHYDSVRVALGSIQEVNRSDNYIRVDGSAWGFVSGLRKSAKRLVVLSETYQIQGVQDNGSNLIVFVDRVPSSSVQPGRSFEAFDHDHLLDVSLVNPALNGNVTQNFVTFLSPLLEMPSTFSNFMLGESVRSKKLFRIKSIEGGSDDFTRRIVAVEYNEEAFNITTPNLLVRPTNNSSLSFVVDHVTIDKVKETLRFVGGRFFSDIQVTFSSAQDTYKAANVYLSTNGGAFIFIGQAKNAIVFQANDKDVLRIRVIAVDVLGKFAPETTAPVATYTVLGKLAPPANVTNFKVTKRPTDLNLTWTAVNEPDIAGYDLLVSTGRNSNVAVATTVVKGFAGTAYPHVVSEANFYRYYIRAIDTSGIYSLDHVIAEVDVKAPSSVYGFTIIQADNRLEFRWEANPETDIVGYEVREGESWASGSFTIRTQSTGFSLSSGALGVRTFWIKAIAAPGIYSDVAVFANNQVTLPKYANVIFSQSEAATGYTGRKFFATTTGTNLTMANGVRRSEYQWLVGLPPSTTAPNLYVNSIAQKTVYSEYRSVPQDTQTWATSTFAWNSDLARRSWVNGESTQPVETRYQISELTGATPRYFEGWRLNNTTTSITSRTPVTSKNVTFNSNGRFDSGVLVKDDTVLDWNVSYPSVFSKIIWINPQEIANTVFLTLKGALGISLSVRYSKTRGAFILYDDLQNEVVVPYLLALKHTCIGISQSTTERKLYVADYDLGNVASKSEPFAPRGSFTNFRLA